MKRKNGGTRPSKLIQRALDLFGSKGQYWIKRDWDVPPQYDLPDGRINKTKHHMYCSVGAVNFVNTKRECEARLYLERGIAKLFPNKDCVTLEYVSIDIPEEQRKYHQGQKVRDIIAFNDAKSTTFPMVRKAFKEAIKLAESEGN